jgi:FkbM family methyltransferase
MTPVFLLKRIIISTQVRWHAVGGSKARAYRAIRRLFRLPHESEFRGIVHFSPSPSSLFLDVGANLGQSIDSIRLYAPGSPIVSFEPNPFLATKLRTLFRNDCNVTIEEYAIGSVDEKTDFYIPVYNGYVFNELASLRKVAIEGWFLKKYISNFREDKYSVIKERWTVKRIDELDLEPFFIKADVQGKEVEVVRGGLATITKYRPIMLLRNVDYDGDLRNMLEPLGYSKYVYNKGHFVLQEERAWNNYFIPDEKLPKTEN